MAICMSIFKIDQHQLHINWPNYKLVKHKLKQKHTNKRIDHFNQAIKISTKQTRNIKNPIWLNELLQQLKLYFSTFLPLIQVLQQFKLVQFGHNFRTVLSRRQANKNTLSTTELTVVKTVSKKELRKCPQRCVLSLVNDHSKNVD